MSIIAIKCAKLLQTATSTSKLTLPIRLARFTRLPPAPLINCASLRSALRSAQRIHCLEPDYPDNMPKFFDPTRKLILKDGKDGAESKSHRSIGPSSIGKVGRQGGKTKSKPPNPKSDSPYRPVQPLRHVPLPLAHPHPYPHNNCLLGLPNPQSSPLRGQRRNWRRFYPLVLLRVPNSSQILQSPSQWHHLRQHGTPPPFPPAA